MSIRFFCFLAMYPLAMLVSANTPPSLDLSPRSGTVGELITFIVAPKDPDGVVAGVYLSNGPSAATLTDNGDGTRTFRWVPKEIGVVTVEMTVTDGQDENLTRSVAIDIAIAGNSVSVNADSSESLSLSALDASSSIDEQEAVLVADVQLSISAASATQTIGKNLPTFAKKYSETVSTAEVTRISDRSNFALESPDISHQYSKRRVWNSDESRMDIENSIIDAETYAVVVESIPLTKERAWSHLDPNKMFGIKTSGGKQNQLVSYNSVSGDISTIFHFNDYSICSMGQWEGDISVDDRYVLVTCRYQSDGAVTAISVDMQARKILGSLALDAEFNWGGFSLSGQYIVIEYAQSWSLTNRSVRYTPQLRNPLNLANDVYHGDFGRDESGNDFYALINGQGIHYYLLASGERVNVGASSDGLGLGAGHLSCRSTQRLGWCFFSSTSTDKIGAVRMAIDASAETSFQSNGRVLYQGVQQFELWGLSRSSDSRYLATPRASVSPNGTKAVFASDWYGSSGVHTYLLEKTR